MSVHICVSLCVCACAHQRGDLCRRISCDEVVSLRWSHSSTSVSLAVHLPFHKEIALLFEVDVTVGAHKAAGVTILVSCFHHRPAVAQKTRDRCQKYSVLFNSYYYYCYYYTHTNSSQVDYR